MVRPPAHPLGVDRSNGSRHTLGKENSHKKTAYLRRTVAFGSCTFPYMGFYEERPPRHGHRTPSELAEDEILSALHGDFCAMPAPFEETGPTSKTECVCSTSVALLPWADAHPFTSTSVMQPRGSAGSAPTPTKGFARTKKPEEHSEL